MKYLLGQLHYFLRYCDVPSYCMLCKIVTKFKDCTYGTSEDCMLRVRHDLVRYVE